MSQPEEIRLGISEARANMTEVIAEVRLLGRPALLTRREKPQAVLVPVAFYEQAKEEHRLVEYIRANWQDIYADMTAALASAES